MLNASVMSYPMPNQVHPFITPNDLYNRFIKEKEAQERKEREEQIRQEQIRLRAENAIENRPPTQDPSTSKKLALIESLKQVPTSYKTYDKPRLDAHGHVVKNNIVSLRPGAGINPGQSTYGFSSMLPSNRAGEAYTIDQWGKKRYL